MAGEPKDDLYFRALVESAQDSMFVIDRGLSVLYANPFASRYFGFPGGGIIGKSLSEIFPPSNFEVFKVKLNSVFETGEPFSSVDEVVFPTATIWLDTKLMPLKDEGGGVRAALGISRDITSHKKAEAAISEAEAKFRTLVENSLVGIYIIRDDRFLYANPKLAEIMGYSQEEMTSSVRVSETVADEDRGVVAENIRKRLSGEAGSLRYSFRARRKDGEVRELEVYGSKTEYEGKTAVIGTLLDITDRRRMDAEMQRAEKLESIGVLAGGIGHEFNNILTAVMGNVSLAKMYTKPGYEAFDILTEIEKASKRAKGLAQQLLTFSQGGAPVKKPVSVPDLLRDSASYILTGTEYKCEFSFEENIRPVLGDRNQLAQAFGNLVINAQQAMPKGGTLTISAENVIVKGGSAFPIGEGRYVRICFADKGVGIPKENLNKVFVPFFSTKEKGSGLGLATAYSIVKKHGGHISVESQSGEGTVFHIWLPASEEGMPVKEGAARTPAFGKGRVLVMDDDELVRTVVSRMLTQCGYEAETAEEGAAAVQMYKKAKETGRPYDAVIVDVIVREGMGGKETIKKLIEFDPTVRAIVSSGYTDDPVMTEFKNYGFKGALPKPYESSDLNRVVQDALKAP